MPLFLTDMLAPEKVVATDYLQPSEALKSMIADAVEIQSSCMAASCRTIRRRCDSWWKANSPTGLST